MSAMTAEERALSSIDRMRAMLDSGKWPSGLAITAGERLLIEGNIGREERIATLRRHGYDPEYPEDGPTRSPHADTALEALREVADRAERLFDVANRDAADPYGHLTADLGKALAELAALRAVVPTDGLREALEGRVADRVAFFRALLDEHPEQFVAVLLDGFLTEVDALMDENGAASITLDDLHATARNFDRAVVPTDEPDAAEGLREAADSVRLLHRRVDRTGVSRTITHGDGATHEEGGPCPHCHQVTRRIERSEAGGSVILQATAVHAHSCPYWREGKRHGPCDCGAVEAWEANRESLVSTVLTREPSIPDGPRPNAPWTGDPADYDGDEGR